MEPVLETNSTTENGLTETNTVENPETVAETVDYIALAVAKLTDELINFKGGFMEDVVHKRTADTLIKFCKQSAAFAEVVARTPRTLSDCCTKMVEGVGRTEGISDIDAFKKAVQFYFPNSDVLFHMQIRHTGSAPSEEEINKPAEKPKPPPAPATTPKNTKSKASAGGSMNVQNTDTDTIHLDLFADDDETTSDKK
jgi:hypothetical protein